MGGTIWRGMRIRGTEYRNLLAQPVRRTASLQAMRGQEFYRGVFAYSALPRPLVEAVVSDRASADQVLDHLLDGRKNRFWAAEPDWSLQAAKDHAEMTAEGNWIGDETSLDDDDVLWMGVGFCAVMVGTSTGEALPPVWHHGEMPLGSEIDVHEVWVKHSASKPWRRLPLSRSRKVVTGSMQATALPSWRDRGAHPSRDGQGAACVISPDMGRGKRNSYMVHLFGRPFARRRTLEEAKATVEAEYGPQRWTLEPGDTQPHDDRVWGQTTEFNDADHYWVVWDLPRIEDRLIQATVHPSVTAGARGDLPEGIEFRYAPDRGTEGRGVTGPGAVLDAYVDGQHVGGLAWYTEFKAGPMGHQKGQVEGIYVEEAWQRRGIATEMWRRAKEVEPRLHHSHALSDDGRAWSQVTSAKPTLERLRIPAAAIEVGDRLDASGKTRVEQIHSREDEILAKTQTRGTRSPSIAQWGAEDSVTVWRPVNTAKTSSTDTRYTTGGDAVPGGYNGYVIAWDRATGEKMGYLDYQSANYGGQKRATVAMVEVEQKYRRQGVATRLFAYVKAEFGHDTIWSSGYLTDDGFPWWGHVRRTFPNMQVESSIQATAADQVPAKIDGPMKRAWSGYSVQAQREIAAAFADLVEGHLRPDPKERPPLVGYWTVPMGGGSATSSPDRIIVDDLPGGGWVLLGAVFDHNYDLAEEQMRGWQGWRERQGLPTSFSSKTAGLGRSLWWRSHPDHRGDLLPEMATSAPFFAPGSVKPYQGPKSLGYSAFKSPWDLWAYGYLWWAGWRGQENIVGFSGDKVGTGHDGEDLVMPKPQGTILRYSADEFLRLLLDTPMPSAPRYACPAAHGALARKDWAEWAKVLAYRDSGDPIEEHIVRLHSRTASKTAAGQTFYYLRNTEPAPDFGVTYGQDIEPAGRYLNISDTPLSHTQPGWESGTVTFANPLVMDWGAGYSSPTGWKRELSERYDGKTGRALSRAIRADGYDAVLTRDKYGWSECVDLTGVSG